MGIPRRWGRIGLVLLVAALLVHAAVVLFGHLRADNPGDLDDSAGLVFDGPSKCHSARTRVLFGQWRTDEWTPYLHSPLHTLLMTGVFKLLGVGFVQMRLPGALASFLSLGLLFLILRPYHRGAAWLAVIIGAVNHVFLMYGRSGLLEPLLIFFMLAAIWMLGCGYRAELDPRTVRRAPWCFALAALAASAAFLTKAISSYFVIVVAAYLWLQPPARKRNTWIFMAVLALVAAAYLGLFVPANRQFLARESSHWIGRALEPDLWRTWARQPFFADMRHAHGMLILAFLSVPFCVRRTTSAEERARLAPVTLLALALLVGSQFLAVVHYRPLRYYLPLVPCAMALAAVAVARLAAWGVNPSPLDRFKWPRWLLGWCMGAYAFMFGVMQPIQAGLAQEKRLPHGWRLAMGAVVVLAIMVFWRLAGARIREGWATRTPRLRLATVLVVFGGLLLVYVRENMDANLFWTHRAVNAMCDISRMLGRDYRDAVFAGTSPNFLVMENRHRALKVTPYGTNARNMRRGLVTHLMLAPGAAGIEEVSGNFTGMKPNAPALERMETSGYVHDLCAVDLRPLESGSLQQEPGGGWSLDVRNPDPHSPQSACLVAIAEAGGRRRCLGADDQKLRPLSSRRFQMAAPEKPADRIEFYLVPRHVWAPEPENADGRNAKRLHDAGAWNMQAWRLKRSSRAPASEESFIETAMGEKEPFLIGVRVSGVVDPADEIRLEEIQDGRVVGRHILPAARVQPDVYLTFTAVAEGAPDRLRLAWRGRAELRVNGFLALSRDKLKRAALWRGTWPENAPL